MALSNYFRKLFTKYNFKRTADGFNVQINFQPVGLALDRAQLALDTQVWNDVRIYMPFATGHLIRQTAKMNAEVLGTGKVYIYDPNVDYAHYMYEGIVYVDPVYHVGGFYAPDYGFWSRPGVRKIPSERPLKYKKAKAVAHWDEEAIKNHSADWVKIVQRELNR